MVIREGVSANSPVKDRSWIRVLDNGTEIEDPEVLSMPAFEKLLGIFPVIPIETFYSCCRVSHHNNLRGRRFISE